MEVESELRKLPAPPDNQTLTVNNLVNEFNKTVREHMHGTNGKNSFQKKLRDAINDFQVALKGLRPRLVVLATTDQEKEQADELRTPGTGARRKNGSEWLQRRDRDRSPLDRMNGGSGVPRNIELEVIDSDDDEPAQSQTTSAKKRRQRAPPDNHTNPTTPAKKQKRFTTTSTPGGGMVVGKEGKKEKLL